MSADSSGKISLALGGARKPTRPPPTNGVKRSHAALHDHEEEESEHGRTQTVSHFDHSAGGAIDEARPVKEEKPLVIAPQANRDWKEASQRNKRQRSGKLAEPNGGLKNEHEGAVKGFNEEEPMYGLNVPSRNAQGDAVTNGHVDPAEAEKEGTEQTNDVDKLAEDKTDDQRAIDALLGKEEKAELVLPTITEEEAFARDFRDAPDMASLADYDRVPVEQFGAALLRGMGWKEGEGIGSNRGKKVEKTKLPERRPALLGIGAKEEAAVAQELGTWGKAAKDRKGPQQIYNPVLLRDKKTGELLTEEELEKKKQRDEREKYEMEFERREKEKRRRERGDSRERNREGREKGSRHDRADDRDRRKYDSDEEYYRRKEKERRRKERDGKDYDRERSRRHDSDREIHRDRQWDHRR